MFWRNRYSLTSLYLLCTTQGRVGGFTLSDGDFRIGDLSGVIFLEPKHTQTCIHVYTHSPTHSVSLVVPEVRLLHLYLVLLALPAEFSRRRLPWGRGDLKVGVAVFLEGGPPGTVVAVTTVGSGSLLCVLALLLSSVVSSLLHFSRFV